MSAKRALVVDDSKSARAFLSRILERHEIAVDAAESAEAAIEYLARNKPDVIFMDHMMPGMDGFQAVQTIKNNPRTSAIPILMYTSQEGDLYLGQARALGAEGVLPKQIRQADVTRLLFQLRLVADRRGDDDQTTFARVAPELMPANESAIVVTPPDEAAPAAESTSVASATPAIVAVAPGSGGADIAQLLPQMSLEIRAALDGSLQKELAALRGYLRTSLDSHAERLQGDLAVTLAAQHRPPEVYAPTMLPERRGWAVAAGWSLAFITIAAAAVMSWLWWQQAGELAAVRTDLAAAYSEVETLRAREAVASQPAAADPAAVVPAADAPDAAPASTASVSVLPNGTPPSAVTAPAAASTAAVETAAQPASPPSNVSAAAVPAGQAQ